MARSPSQLSRLPPLPSSRTTGATSPKLAERQIAKMKEARSVLCKRLISSHGVYLNSLSPAEFANLPTLETSAISATLLSAFKGLRPEFRLPGLDDTASMFADGRIPLLGATSTCVSVGSGEGDSPRIVSRAEEMFES